MSDLMNGLRIKYGLGENPSDAQVKEWATLTEKLIAGGASAESAGEQAASRIFRGYKSHFFKAQADTIVTLLEAAKRR